MQTTLPAQVVPFEHPCFPRGTLGHLNMNIYLVIGWDLICRCMVQLTLVGLVVEGPAFCFSDKEAMLMDPVGNDLGIGSSDGDFSVVGRFRLILKP